MGCLAIYLFTGKYMIEADRAPGVLARYLEVFRKGVVTLPKVSRYSLEFIHFVDLCLTWDESSRPTAYCLLKHPFLTNGELTRLEAPIDLVLF